MEKRGKTAVERKICEEKNRMRWRDRQKQRKREGENFELEEAKWDE